MNKLKGIVKKESKKMGVGFKRRRCDKRKEEGEKGRVREWGEVVKR